MTAKVPRIVGVFDGSELMTVISYGEKTKKSKPQKETEERESLEKLSILKTKSMAKQRVN